MDTAAKRLISTATMIAERELIAAAIKTAIEYARSSNGQALKEMGYEPQDIEVLKAMSVSDLLDLCDLNTRTTFVNVSVERPVFVSLLRCLEIQRSERQLIDDLMRHGASFHVLHKLFGMGQADYANLNRTLGEPAKPGRPQNVSDADADTIWQLWHDKRVGALDLRHKLLLISRETAVPIAAIWMLIQQWYQEGMFASGADLELDAVMTPVSAQKPVFDVERV